MKNYLTILMFVFSSLISWGCTDDFLNSAFRSEENRIKAFKEHQDWHIGKPFLGKLSDVCSTHKCSDTDQEKISIEIKINQKCAVVWVVKNQIGQKYYHPTNGLVFDMIGTRLSWNYLSDPNVCLDTLAFWGPW